MENTKLKNNKYNNEHRNVNVTVHQNVNVNAISNDQKM